MSANPVCSMPANRRAKGAAGEALAVEFLTKKGYTILVQNYRYERAEIDIIAEHASVLAFIEVKARRSNSYGEPEEAVTVAKQNQIRKAADGYLFERNLGERECRFDVITIITGGLEPVIRHIENAF